MSPRRVGFARRPASLAFVAALFLGLASWTAAAEKAPSFSGNALLDGTEFSLDPYLGKVPVLLDFGSIYCSSCVTSIPHMITIQNKYGPEKLRVVGVNLDTYGIIRVRKFFAAFEKNLSFPIIPDLDLKISRQYNVSTLPTYVLVGKDGNVAATFVGYDEEIGRRIDEAVRRLVEEGAVAGEQPAPVVQDVALLTPENFTKTYQDAITVIGLSGGREGPFTLRLNGGSEKTAKTFGKMFAVRTLLSLGSNFIEIRYPNGGTQGSLALVLFREPVMGEGLQVAFPQYQFHVPDREARCTPCHEMEPKGDDPTSLAAATTFCLRCHDYLTTNGFVHGPITVGGCSPCHDFASKPHQYELVAQGSGLCFSCHDDIRAKFAKANLHGPVAMGLCAVCHSPHSSPFKFQIRLPQGDLCLSCHEGMKPKAAMFFQHKPFRDGRCTDCHDPHASDNPKYFLKGVGEALCALCHNEKTGMQSHKHPVGRPPKFTVKGMKLSADGNLTCFTCHDPHASDSEKMSPVPNGCAGCHQI